MADRSVPLVSIASGVLGVVVTAFALFVSHQNYAPLPPPNNADNTGLAIFFIAPIAVVGGALLAHAIYRYVPPADRAPWWLVVYPLASAGTIALVGLYIVLITESISYESLPELVIPASVAGVVVAGVVWLTDLARSRSARRAG